MELAEDERPIISLGKENPFGELLPGIYQMFHKKEGYSEVCRHFAIGIYFLLQRILIERNAGEAQSLLVETSMAIQEIEFRLGFSDSAHFSKMFKKTVGVTPKEYRKHFSERRRRQ